VPTVLVSGIEFYGFHGVSEAERVVGHRFSVDVELEVEPRATETDDLEDTVDYGAVAQLIVEVGETGSCKTVERLAMIMANRLLEKQPLVASVTIEVRKLLPPIPLTVESAGVRLMLDR
jgi:dihydroneopterin aldolase